MILAFLRETVFTGKITVVGDMQTERLHHSLSVFEIKDIIFVDILRIELSGLRK